MKTATKILLNLFLIILLLSAVVACEGEDGMDGAQGLPGMDGINGVDGQDGSDGEDGADGNTNVYSVSFNAYSVTRGQNEFDIPQLTQEIFDHGFVLGYATVSGNAFWETLPIVINENVWLDIDRIEVGKIILTSTFDQTLDFRFVLVEGTDLSAITSKTYEELQKDLGWDN